MRLFSVPSDFKTSTLLAYQELNKKYKNSKVIETYGQITIDNVFGSGRVASTLPQIDLESIKEYVEFSNKCGIEFNYTLNPSHMGNYEFTKEGANNIIDFIGKLYDIGIRSLTVALPSLIEIIKMSRYDFKIKASAVCSINTVNKAKSFKEIGAHRIVADESINRKFKKLKDMRNYAGIDIEVIVNSVCHKDCIYKNYHYNAISCNSYSESSDISNKYYSNICSKRRLESPANILKLCWIRPEDIKFYEAIGVVNYKIQGRHNVLKGDLLKVIECYFNESYDGNLMSLLNLFENKKHEDYYISNKKLENFIKPFKERDEFCDNNCNSCRYCSTFFNENIEDSY